MASDQLLATPEESRIGGEARPLRRGERDKNEMVTKLVPNSRPSVDIGQHERAVDFAIRVNTYRDKTKRDDTAVKKFESGASTTARGLASRSKQRTLGGRQA